MRWRWLGLWEHFELESHLCPETVRARFEGIEDEAEVDADFPLSWLARQFSGKFDGARFEFSYRRPDIKTNIFPIIVGEIEPAFGGSRLTGRIQIHPYGMFMLLWAGVLSFGGASSVIFPWSPDSLKVCWAAALLGAIFPAVIFFWYKAGASRAKKAMLRLLEIREAI